MRSYHGYTTRCASVLCGIYFECTNLSIILLHWRKDLALVFCQYSYQLHGDHQVEQIEGQSIINLNGLFCAMGVCAELGAGHVGVHQELRRLASGDGGDLGLFWQLYAAPAA